MNVFDFLLAIDKFFIIFNPFFLIFHYICPLIFALPIIIQRILIENLILRLNYPHLFLIDSYIPIINLEV